MTTDASPLAADIVTGREILRTSRGIVILTGAGLSADSGLTTFRDPKGHWRRHRPEELATPEAFRRDPCLVWDWYDARRRAAADTVPNAAHFAIAEFALRRDDVVIVTQNVDGLHTLAAREVADERLGGAGGEVDREANHKAKALPIELHGCFYRTRCSGCGRRHEHRDCIDTSSKQTLPHCAECSELLRPDVVWFGEPLGESIDRAFGCASRSEVCVVVGTSAVVQPAASVAMVTRRAGGAIIEVNPEETPLTPMSAVSLRSTAAEVVPQLLARG